MLRIYYPRHVFVFAATLTTEQSAVTTEYSMPPYIPPRVANNPLFQQITGSGLQVVHRGKVRDSFEGLYDGLGYGRDEVRLIVASPRVSAHDYVLGKEIPGKGEVLTAMTVFWTRKILRDIPHHLIAWGSAIDEFLPVSLRRYPALQRCAVVVKKKRPCKIEAIVRGYMTGSGWKKYVQTGGPDAKGVVCGQTFPAGLHDGSRLRRPYFTPSTKAEVGHDEHLSAAEVAAAYGDWPAKLALTIYNRGVEHARKCGIIIADTKFEFGDDQSLIDELLTPDSSRFWDYKDWRRAAQKRRAPIGFDKQPLRDYLLELVTPKGTFDELSPENPDDVVWVGDHDLPDHLCEMLSRRYQEIGSRLLECPVSYYQRHEMGIAA